MTIKTQFRLSVLASICSALIVGGLLIYADRGIDRETQRNLLADRISKGVSELFMMTRSYLMHGEERPRMQWQLRAASLRRLIANASPAGKTGDENLEIISRRLDEMEDHFKQMVVSVERLQNSAPKERDLIQEVIERLATRVTADGQEMVNQAFLLIEESNQGLSLVRKRTIFLVIASILLAMVASGGISLLLSGRILRNLEHLQRGAEIVAGGGLDHRLNIRRGDEIGRFADAFDKMTDRLQDMYERLEAEIAERTKAEDRLRAAATYTRSLIESSLDPLVTISPEGKIMDVNKATELVTGASREQLIGTDFSNYFTEPEKARQGYRHVFEKGSIADYALAIRHLSGPVTDVLYNAAVYRRGSGEIEGVFAAARDITRQKRAEEELDRYTRELERSNAELEQFAYVASHDLQEPLRKIQVFSDLMLSKKQEQMDQEGRDYLTRMAAAANRMKNLLDAVLRYSRVSTKGTNFEPVELNRIIREAQADLELAIQKRRGRVETASLPVVTGDPEQLRQLFQNLISNAIKYQRTGIDPVVRIQATSNGTVHTIYVEDNGIGMEEKYLGQIFKPFQRLHCRHEVEGTGMGLAICRKIVERHKGEINVRSRPGEGSAFIVTLPGGPCDR